MEGFEKPENRPQQDVAWEAYSIAYSRLRRIGAPMAYADISAYYRDFDLPYTLGVFTDAMRALECDDIQAAHKLPNSEQ